jgi:hypothetical protein
LLVFRGREMGERDICFYVKILKYPAAATLFATSQHLHHHGTPYTHDVPLDRALAPALLFLSHGGHQREAAKKMTTSAP